MSGSGQRDSSCYDERLEGRQNSVFRVEKGSPQEVYFRLFKSGLFLQKMRKVSVVHTSNIAANVSSTFSVTNPMGLALETTLCDDPYEVRNDTHNETLMFIKRYQEDSNLLGHKM